MHPQHSSEPSKPRTTENHIRGSSLLLAGRFAALGLNFVTQVIAVRYLSKSDYGAFAYALSIVYFCGTLSAFGMDKAAGRYVPIYREKHDWNRMFGAMALMATTIVGVGLAVAAVLLGLRGLIFEPLAHNPQCVGLLVILIALAPVQALDDTLVSLFAVFTGARAIFWRKHVLGPALKIVAVLLVVGLHGDVRAMAAAHLLAGAAGTVLYGIVLLQVLHRQGLLEHFEARKLLYPVRSVIGFGLPLLVSDLMLMLRGTLAIVLLEHFRGSETVAAYSAVVPVARLNTVVRASFTFLFMPAAVRLLVRDDREGLDDLYWRSAIWITLLTLPIFVVTFALSGPVTVLLFGHRYAGSGFILSCLALGQFFNSSLGLNGLMLRVLGRVRYIIAVDVSMTVLSFVTYLLVIPRWGAAGAAVTTCGILIAHCLLNQVGLYHGSGVSLVNAPYMRLYGSLVIALAALLLGEQLFAPPIYLGMFLAVLASMLVMVANRHLMELHTTFPELARIPGMRQMGRLLGSLGRPT